MNKKSDIKNVDMKNDFPLLKNKINKIIYLDSAATTQKPHVVIESLKDFYEKNNANTHRGIYKLSEQATLMLEDARETFASFIDAEPSNIIFTKSATEGFNQLANSIERTLYLKDKNIVVTVMEHHSNFIPWQQLCKRNNMEFRVVPLNDVHNIAKYIDDDTLLVSFTGMSNVNGLMLDVKAIVKNIRKKHKHCMVIVDATQLAAHKPIDVKDLGVDALCFSAHKIYGTTGVGVIYMENHLLHNLEPFFFGGNMIREVNIKESIWAEHPEKFEAGTIDTPGIVASAQAIKYLKSKDFKKLLSYEESLKKYALERLKDVKDLKIIGHNPRYVYGPVISFIIKGVHPHDLATIADQHNICIRAGHHCAQPFMNALGVVATSRISLSFYNTKEDIDRFIEAINHAKKLLGD